MEAMKFLLTAVCSVTVCGSAFAAPPPPPPPKKKENRREALLCALKPYLSPDRREMADYLIRICRVYDALTGLL